jgi:hypothetical protein
MKGFSVILIASILMLSCVGYARGCPDIVKKDKSEVFKEIKYQAVVSQVFVVPSQNYEMTTTATAHIAFENAITVKNAMHIVNFTDRPKALYWRDPQNLVYHLTYKHYLRPSNKDDLYRLARGRLRSLKSERPLSFSTS